MMYVIARRKLAVAQQLGRRAMRADAIESVTCGWLTEDDFSCGEQ